MFRRAHWGLAATLCGWSGAAWGAPEQAFPSDSLVQSTGINTHFLDTGTVYTTEFNQVAPLLFQSGLRIVREASLGTLTPVDGGFDFTAEPYLAMVVAGGIHVNYLCDLNAGTPANCRDEVKGLNALFPGAVVSVEGPNEPDGFWANLYPAGYNGQGFPAGSIAWQQLMYTTLKADPATAAIPVYGIALGLAGQPPCLPSNPNPLGDGGQLANAVDFGNFHPYPTGNPWHPDIAYDFVPATDGYYHRVVIPSADLDPTPSAGLVGFDDDVCQDSQPYAPKPMVATESGVQTADGGIPESNQAALVSRIILENYRLGIVRTLLYELIDSGGQTFGMLRADASPRPAYLAIQALLTRLADPGPGFTPASLDYSLTATPVVLQQGNPDETFNRLEYIHHLLFEKRSGVFELVIWHEIATDETYPTYVPLSPPAMPGVLAINQPFASATLTTLADTGQPSTVPLSLDGGISLAINQYFQIVELVPSSAMDGGGPVDAGVPSRDAGLGGPDGGESPVDAGRSPLDAGALDARANPDAGARNPSTDGCSCQAQGNSPAASGGVLLLALVFMRRRKRLRVRQLPPT